MSDYSDAFLFALNRSIDKEIFNRYWDVIPPKYPAPLIVRIQGKVYKKLNIENKIRVLWWAHNYENASIINY